MGELLLLLNILGDASRFAVVRWFHFRVVSPLPQSPMKSTLCHSAVVVLCGVVWGCGCADFPGVRRPEVVWCHHHVPRLRLHCGLQNSAGPAGTGTATISLLCLLRASARPLGSVCVCVGNVLGLFDCLCLTRVLTLVQFAASYMQRINDSWHAGGT